ncbi:aspartate/glutamate racemase family protein [Novosphingobium huizhouense]|uniref:aspartate/glutamate racemase family protein n=1 Tax=Novosphingobium huizhouense TaxID=2866625 RepID=UPI001CD89074|nr:aspartate/glutamate racemase family protein [Novosphingobium huizhouense]
MRRLGLIGGMSWESTAHYYRLINGHVRAARGPAASADLLLHSLDFAPIAQAQREGRWDELAATLAGSARLLAGGGAEALVLCTNTMHRLADAIAAATPVPLLHIADPTGAAIVAAGHARVALLGTAFTMEQDFYTGRLRARHGLEVIVPEAEDRALVHRVIYEELVAGIVAPASREAYRAVIARLVDRGAQSIILGCTEIMLLVDHSDSAVPLFDTTALHARAAADFALGTG